MILLKDYRIEKGVLSGSGFETDFASFVAWRDWNFPDRDVFNVFAMAAVRAADGGYLLGQMAERTPPRRGSSISLAGRRIWKM